MWMPFLSVGLQSSISMISAWLYLCYDFPLLPSRSHHTPAKTAMSYCCSLKQWALTHYFPPHFALALFPSHKDLHSDAWSFTLTSFSFYADVTSLERTLPSILRQQPRTTIFLPCVIFLHSRSLLLTLYLFAHVDLLVYKLCGGWGFMAVSVALRMLPDPERLSINISWMNDMAKVYHQMSYSFSLASSWLPQCPMLSSSWASNLLTHSEWLVTLKMSSAILRNNF